MVPAVPLETYLTPASLFLQKVAIFGQLFRVWIVHAQLLVFIVLNRDVCHDKHHASPQAPDDLAKCLHVICLLLVAVQSHSCLVHIKHHAATVFQMTGDLIEVVGAVCPCLLVVSGVRLTLWDHTTCKLSCLRKPWSHCCNNRGDTPVSSTAHCNCRTRTDTWVCSSYTHVMRSSV